MSPNGSLASVSVWRARRSVSPSGRGVITFSVTGAGLLRGRRGPPAGRAGSTRRNCHRLRNKLLSRCCARTVSLMSVCRNVGRRCSTKASTCARNRRCIGSCATVVWQVNAVNANRAGTTGRGWSRLPRTWFGSGTSSATRRFEPCGDERTPPSVRRSGPVEAEGSLIRETPGRVASSPDNAGTHQHCQMVWVRQARQDGVTTVNQRMNASQEWTTSSNLTDLGWAAVRTSTMLVGGTLWPVDVAGWEATPNACGVGVAKPQGQSWAPRLSNGSQ